MIVLLSPAKSLDLETPAPSKQCSQPRLLKQSEILVQEMVTRSPADLEKLMKISPALAELNVERFQTWSRPFHAGNAKQAIFAFQGDVYQGLQINNFTAKQLDYAQQHLRILSGLYGVLKPLDFIQAYRLEMGVKLAFDDYRNLYQFWGDTISKTLYQDAQEANSNYFLNLASNEYYKVVQAKLLQKTVISPIFKDWKNGQYKIISFYAKKARGTMAAWALNNAVKTPSKLKQFKLDGYAYSENDSSDTEPVFLRKLAQ